MKTVKYYCNKCGERMIFSREYLELKISYAENNYMNYTTFQDKHNALYCDKCLVDIVKVLNFEITYQQIAPIKIIKKKEKNNE